MKLVHFLILILVLTGGVFAFFISIKDFKNEQSVLSQENSSDFGRVYASTNLNDQFGINGALPSLTTNTSKMTSGAAKIAEAHLGWSRHEFHYSSRMSYNFYDSAKRAQDAKGIKTLGLLAYPGRKDINIWKNYVRSVVGHYGSSITAWEIMNEIDNHLTASEYAEYLKEAHTIIKGINPNAIVISSGISSRPEAASFIDGLASAGVWDKFDAVGLHIYHAGSPETVNWGGGNVSSEISRIIGSINRNGGNKKIWITEIGYQSSEVGEENQGNFLARASIMAKSFPEVDKIFFYRLYDNSDQRFGLTNSAFSQKKSFNIIKNTVNELNGKGPGEQIFTSYDVLDNNEPSPSGWDTGETTNTDLGLSGDSGIDNTALKMHYRFNMGSDYAYASAEKLMGQVEHPAAITAWVKGDNSKNVIKLRMLDNEGETFQLDFGSLSSNWQNVRFIFNRDPGITSWDGNGQLDFPIQFKGIIIDRQGGQEEGEIMIDKIGFLPNIDTYAYKFGDFVSYWKQEGTGRFGICGQDHDFNGTPQLLSGC